MRPNARPPGRRRQILDQPLPIVMDWAMMGKPLLSTQPENPSANRKMAPPIPWLRDTSSMAGPYFARMRLVVIGGIDDGRRYRWTKEELAHLRQKEQRGEDDPEDEDPDGFPHRPRRQDQPPDQGVVGWRNGS